jgi:hypothetical protein
MSYDARSHRPSAHRRHPAYAPRPAPSGIHSSELGAAMIIAALSFAAIGGAVFHAFGSSLLN